jgi:cytochrome c oxidase subunit 1
MAIIERPSTVPAVAGATPRRRHWSPPPKPSASSSVPVSSTGWKSWVFTVDHKKLGIMYGVVRCSSSSSAAWKRCSSASSSHGPDGTVLSADLYNQMFTMHGTTMVFLFVMPMAPRSPTTCCRCRSVPATSRSPASTPSASGAVPVRRHLPQLVVVPRRRRRRRLVHVRAELQRCCSRRATASTSGCLGCRSRASPRWSVRQPDRHHHQHAGPGHDLMRMPVFTWMNLSCSSCCCSRCPVITGGAVPADVRPLFGANFFDVGQRRRPAAVAAPVLDLRSPRGVHHHPARLRHRLRDAPGVQPQAALRLPVHGVLGHRDRLHRLGRVGAPHVRQSGIGPMSVAVFSVATMFIAMPTGVKIVNWTPPCGAAS